MNFPTLYKKTSTGASQYWTISTRDNSIVTKWGQVGGKEQETVDLVKEGKNAGKKNATDPIQQAQLEAKSQWEKKLKKSYVKTLEAARAGEVDAVIEGGVNPMLAHPFDEHGHKITYPCFVQPKFDGHRCIVEVKNGKATMWTRTRKPITGLPHIIVAVEAWSQRIRRADIVLDGELYNHAHKDNFEELSHFIRSPNPEDGHEVIQYHVYDVADNNTEFADRHSILRAFSFQSPYLVPVQTPAVSSKEELQDKMDEFLDQGYEGLIVRQMNAKYENKRSYGLQKYKEFQDAEFTVIGVNEGRGKLRGHAATFTFKTEPKEYPAGRRSVRVRGGDEFKAKLKGSTAELKKFFEHPELALGRLMTVKYQGISNKNQVPRFGVALRFFEEL